MILGGVTYDLGDIKTDVYHYNPSTHSLVKKTPMLEPRERPAVVYRDGFVYVLGGKYSYNTCERYSIGNDSWTIFPPLKYGRYDA